MRTETRNPQGERKGKGREDKERYVKRWCSNRQSKKEREKENTRRDGDRIFYIRRKCVRDEKLGRWREKNGIKP